MNFQDQLDALNILLYRVCVYAVNNLIDDPAMLAIVFC